MEKALLAWMALPDLSSLNEEELSYVAVITRSFNLAKS